MRRPSVEFDLDRRGSREVRVGMTKLRCFSSSCSCLERSRPDQSLARKQPNRLQCRIVSTPSEGAPTRLVHLRRVRGAITDSGTVTTVLVHAAALGSPVTGTAQYVRTFHGEAGTFTIRLQTRLFGTDDPSLFEEEGEWTVIDGSGDYAGLLGQGHESGIRDFQNQSLDVEYTGALQLL